MSKKILITGGPVGAKLDPVKIVTNRFKGGRIAELAWQLSLYEGVEVTYLCSKGSVEPDFGDPNHGSTTKVEIIHHDGFHDYMKQVCELTPSMDAVILGAAVANLIPVRLYRAWKRGQDFPGFSIADHEEMPLVDKFPSHDYKPGDRIFMEWTIAPRIIDMVKERLPKTGHLFGFKLLAGQPHEELIRAAYEVLLESRATAVIANDAKKGLDTKHIVTKERGVHTVEARDLANWILQVLQDEYYRTEFDHCAMNSNLVAVVETAGKQMEGVIDRYRDRFVEVEDGMKFGTVAWRVNPHGNGFVTTGRGKRELDEFAYVLRVVHNNKIVVASGMNGDTKATLNAPLLDRIFHRHSEGVQGIVHLHEQVEGLPTFPYAPPGTVRDSTTRPCDGPFNIEGHGCFLLLDRERNEL